jgi:hypothetical protein
MGLRHDRGRGPRSGLLQNRAALDDFSPTTGGPFPTLPPLALQLRFAAFKRAAPAILGEPLINESPDR